MHYGWGECSEKGWVRVFGVAGEGVIQCPSRGCGRLVSKPKRRGYRPSGGRVIYGHARDAFDPCVVALNALHMLTHPFTTDLYAVGVKAFHVLS